MTNQGKVDRRIQIYYEQEFDEDVRLTTRSAAGRLEFTRTQEIIARHVPMGRVADIGGGTGRHAVALRARGLDVTLVDPVARHVAHARAVGVDAQVGDARSLPFDDAMFDAALLFGPLYHLASSHDRLRALREAARVLRPGGVILAVGLSRFVRFESEVLGGTPDLESDLIELLASGRPPRGGRFPAGHFHTGEELHAEISAAGFDDVDVVGAEGPAGAYLETVDVVDPSTFDAALSLARVSERSAATRDLSAHLIGVGRRA